jgi:predicted S18 family serine protease
MRYLLLTTRLGRALADRAVLSIILAALITAGMLGVQAASVSIESDEKSRTIELQSQEIELHLAAIAVQRQEIEAKAAQLELLNSEMASMSEETASLSGELQEQARRLQTEIGLLQSKIESDEQYIADLTRQLQAIQESAKITRVSHYGLAVVEGKGIVFPIEVDIINSGSGAVSVDVSNVVYEADFQGAVRTAAAVAAEYSGEQISDKNIVVRLIIDNEGDQITIDGSSAGGLIAAMMVAGLTDTEINGDVLVTGTIKPDGSVGVVGSIPEKTEAAMDFGAHILVVPEVQDFPSDRLVVIGASEIDDILRYLIAPD